MARSKFGLPRAQDGELKAQFGYSADDGESIFYVRGEGVPRADAHLLHHALSQRPNPPAYSFNETPEVELSLLEELTRRGYDIKTLRISIKKA